MACRLQPLLLWWFIPISITGRQYGLNIGTARPKSLIVCFMSINTLILVVATASTSIANFMRSTYEAHAEIQGSSVVVVFHSVCNCESCHESSILRSKSLNGQIGISTRLFLSSGIPNKFDLVGFLARCSYLFRVLLAYRHHSSCHQSSDRSKCLDRIRIWIYPAWSAAGSHVVSYHTTWVPRHLYRY